jgi:hypothetical protein
MSKTMTRNAAFFVAGGCGVALFLAGAAHAITDTVFKYSTPKTGQLSLDPMAFAPASYIDADQYSMNWDGGIMTTNATCFNTGVNLPQGSNITALTMWESNSNSVSGIDPGIKFVRKNLSTGTAETIAQADFTDASGVRKGKSIGLDMNRTHVDNAHYSYGLGGCINSHMVFYGARITYTYTAAGD